MSRRIRLFCSCSRWPFARAPTMPAFAQEPAVHGHRARELRRAVGDGVPARRAPARHRAARRAEALHARRRERRRFAACRQVGYGGQGGFGDVVLHPDFASNGLVYLSYAEAGEGETRGAAVARAKLALARRRRRAAEPAGHLAAGRRRSTAAATTAIASRSATAISGSAPASARSSIRRRTCSEPRQDPAAQRRRLACRPTIRSRTTAASRRRSGRSAIATCSASRSTRAGRLWDVEMGPMGGDELNLVRRGANYGYPIVSNGDHYDGKVIPDHRHAARVRGAGGVLESRDLAVEPAVLRRQRVPAMARRRVHRRLVVASRSCASSSTATARARPSATTWACACARSSRARRRALDARGRARRPRRPGPDVQADGARRSGQ